MPSKRNRLLQTDGWCCDCSRNGSPSRRSRFSALICVIAFFLAADTASGQIILRGEVIDEETDQPLPLVHILVEGSYFGTTTNRQGQFLLQIDELPVRLLISHLGYSTIRANVETAGRQIQIRLPPAVISLDSLVVPASYPEALVQNAYERAREDRKDYYQGRGFYRHTTRSDTVFTELLEMFVNTATSNDGVSRWDLEHGRYAVRPDTFENNYIHTRDFSLLTRDFSLVQTTAAVWSEYLFPLRNRAERYFDFELVERIHQDDRPIARIQYSPKDHIRRPSFHGQLHIDESSYHIMHFEAYIEHPNYRPLRIRGNRSFIDGDIGLRYEASYRRTPDDHVVMDFLAVDAFYTQKRRRAFEREIHTRSILFFYEHAFDFNPRRIRWTPRTASDYRLIDRTRYVPEFWAENPIIAETPVEEEVRESFERSGSFGKIFDN